MRYIEQKILGQSRHQIIYGEDAKEKDKLINNLLDDYPVKPDSYSPIAVKVEDFALDINKRNIEQVDRNHLALINREYLLFQVVYHILKRIKNEIGIKECNLRSKKLLTRVNEILIKNEDNFVKDFNELIRNLEISCFTYRELWNRYLTTGEKFYDFKGVKIPFGSDLQFWLYFIKDALNNPAYFGIITDIESPISLTSQECLNDLVGSRINSDISMKIMLDPNNYLTSTDTMGNYVQLGHDYEIVELDDSYHKLMRIK